MTDRELMRQALKALEMANELCYGHGVDFKEYGLEFDSDIKRKYEESIVALRERLAQPEQEPVIGKWSLREVYFDEDGEPISHRSPPQRKPLTDEEIREIADKHLFYQPEGYEVSGVFALARAIEAKLKEKNA